MKLKQDDGLECESELKSTMPARLGSFILSNSKRIMNNFLREINDFETNNVYYTYTNSLFFEKKHWAVLDEATLVGENIRHSKNDYKIGGIFYALFLAPEIKFCLAIDGYGIIEEHETFTDSQRLLDENQYFEMLIGNKIHA